MILPNVEGLRIPPRDVVPKPDDDDPIDYYYKPLTGRLYRARLARAVDLLGDARYAALLEIGYGSGVFLLELAHHADRLAAIDIHPQSAAVDEMLTGLGVEAELFEASLFELPFAAGEFDALVCLSVLEHLTELSRALDEFRRVLEPGGVAVLGFPARNPLTDGFFRLAGYSPRAIHPSGHRDILGAAERHPGFRVERREHFPSLLPMSLSAYVLCRCRAC